MARKGRTLKANRSTKCDRPRNDAGSKRDPASTNTPTDAKWPGAFSVTTRTPFESVDISVFVGNLLIAAAVAIAGIVEAATMTRR
jgi:hypothetical protein